jgi:hypothetical protein
MRGHVKYAENEEQILVVYLSRQSDRGKSPTDGASKRKRVWFINK